MLTPLESGRHRSTEARSLCVVVGAGAAGLMAAIAAARAGCRVALLDRAARIGAKILISGGGRCNVTNRLVTAGDFNGSSRRLVGRVLDAWSVDDTVRFFAAEGVSLHEEAYGKLFPDTNRARSVVDALVSAAVRAGVEVRTSCDARAIRAEPDGLVVETASGAIAAPRVVLASGGCSVPRTGSDGSGYALAAALGHSIVPTSPALVPLRLDGTFHQPLAGISHEAAVDIAIDGRRSCRIQGPLLWTHVGVSGPAVLDASRHWHRATMQGRDVALTLDVRPDSSYAAVEGDLVEAAAARPRASVESVLASWLPAAVAAALTRHAAVEPGTTMAHLPREARRRLAHAITALPLDVRDSRGYEVAEVTAGGVPLDEIDTRTMASRRCGGLFLAGEILDVDGRLGGFNFQWAWASGTVAGRGMAASLGHTPP